MPMAGLVATVEMLQPFAAPACFRMNPADRAKKKAMKV
jgi:hypothetical protein